MEIQSSSVFNDTFSCFKRQYIDYSYSGSKSEAKSDKESVLCSPSPSDQKPQILTYLENV